MKKRFELSQVILSLMLLNQVLGVNNCKKAATCITNGIDSWAFSCYKGYHSHGPSYSSSSCDPKKNPIENCLVVKNSGVDDYQYCLRCEDGYALMSFRPKDLSKFDGRCYKITVEKAATAHFSSSVSNSRVFFITSCEFGYKPDKNHFTCIPVEASDKQDKVENCFGYYSGGCYSCKPGYTLYRYKNKIGSPTDFTLYMEACLKLQDKIVGCDGYTATGFCEKCDFRNGFYSVGAFHESAIDHYQPQVCSNGKSTLKASVE